MRISTVWNNMVQIFMVDMVMLDNKYHKCGAGLHSAVGCTSNCRFRGHKFESQLGHINSVEIDCEIISMVILPL